MPRPPVMFSGTGLLSLETIVRFSTGILQSVEVVFHVLGSVFLRVCEIIIDGLVGIQFREGCQCRGHLGIVDHQELIAARVIRQFHAIGRQGEFDPQLGSVGMFASFENGGGTNFIGCAVFGDNQADVVIALQDLIYTVMQEADADNAFSGATFLEGPEPLLVYWAMFLSSSTK